MAIASAASCNLSVAFSSPKTSIGPFSGAPKCLNFVKVRSLQRNSGPRLVARAAAAGSGGGCCGGSGSSSSSEGSSCSSHGKSTDLSNVGKEFEAMVARATLSEFEKEYDSKEMEGNISRDVIKEVMNIGPSSFAHQQKGETILDLTAVLSDTKNDEDIAFDNDENVFV